MNLLPDVRIGDVQEEEVNGILEIQGIHKKVGLIAAEVQRRPAR